MRNLTDRQRQVLRHVPDQPTMTDEIADSMREETHWIASPMKALERKGCIECVARGGRGISSKWRRTPEGRKALEAPDA